MNFSFLLFQASNDDADGFVHRHHKGHIKVIEIRHGCFDETGRDQRKRYARLLQIDAQAFSKVAQGGLAGRIGR